eukprot:CAMPEP_0171462366 /NCGR_PEP_ID=MMETSP0945-20130129/6431_1 /TAXON_ID=109269 /ORGANISM="Vaucheria litorea, Strain CCMP2940" /LENGTH=570 /DNA_ID=CAMNT_0011988875 /DNA_START=603 /DNA_END=2313 /DNA_ORIENTATION=+
MGFPLPPWQLTVPKKDQVEVPTSLEITDENPVPAEFELIDTESKLRALIENLVGEREIAVDLEAMIFAVSRALFVSYSSAIDPIALKEKIHLLRPIFSDPLVLKIFHDARMDVKWLQRDFGIYVVNLFDTFVGAKELNLPNKGLSNLIFRYLNLHTTKKHQLSDWRVRPLPVEMLHYAQSDTHYLFYISDMIKIDLGSSERIKKVHEDCRTVSMNRYEKPVFIKNGWKTNFFGYKNNKKDEKYEAIVKGRMSDLWEWRDRIAREEDESVNYVMALPAMQRIAQSGPENEFSLFNCIKPLPNLVKKYSNEIVAIVSNAKPFWDDKEKNKSSSSSGKVKPEEVKKKKFEIVTPASLNFRMESIEIEDGVPKSKKRLVDLAPENSNFSTKMRFQHSMSFRTITEMDNDAAKAMKIREEISRQPIMSLANISSFDFEKEGEKIPENDLEKAEEKSNVETTKQYMSLADTYKGNEIVKKVEDVVEGAKEGSCKRHKRSMVTEEMDNESVINLADSSSEPEEEAEAQRMDVGLDLERLERIEVFDYSQVKGAVGAAEIPLEIKNNPFITKSETKRF